MATASNILYYRSCKYCVNDLACLWHSSEQVKKRREMLPSSSSSSSSSEISLALPAEPYSNICSSDKCEDEINETLRASSNFQYPMYQNLPCSSPFKLCNATFNFSDHSLLLASSQDFNKRDRSSSTYVNVPKCSADGVQPAYLRIAYSRLQSSGWYYEKCDASEATQRLSATEQGTFLVRDSANSQFLFSISIQTLRGPTSLRVASHGDAFYIDVDQLQTPLLPRFDCIIKLVSWLVAVSQCLDKNKTPVAVLEIAGTKDVMPVLLRRPLLNKVLPLKSLSRKVIHCYRLRNRVRDKNLLQYLDDYPYAL